MDAVHQIAITYRMPIFDVLNEDVDTFILLLNYLIQKGQEDDSPVKTEAGQADVIWDYI